MAERAERERILSERNIALLREAYEAIGEDGLEGAAAWELIDDDILIRDRPEAPDPQTYRGREGARKALAVSDESFESFAMVPVELIGVGDQHVVVVLRMSGRGRGSGVPVEETIAHLWTVRGGKAVALQVYTDPEDALRDARAAGDADGG
jgi:ketosteroid isomerase-like protein